MRTAEATADGNTMNYRNNQREVVM